MAFNVVTPERYAQLDRDTQRKDGKLDHRYLCPVCGLDNTWTEPLEFLSGSFDICPQCGNEFGYTDASRSHETLRQEWIARGRPWHSNVVSAVDVQAILQIHAERQRRAASPDLSLAD